MIEKESDINAVSVRALRKSLNLHQSEFWGRVCITNAVGSKYETGKHPMPKVVVRALYLHYVVGIPCDTAAIESVKDAVENAVEARTAYVKSLLEQGAAALTPKSAE